MDDYEYDGDGFEYGDDWIYVEDEFSTADELAEGQIASPGYTGTNHEISMESYDFDLYDYFEDLEYADDAYWDYGMSEQKGETGQKRKRVAKFQGLPAKRRKTAPKADEDEEEDRDSQPMVFLSCEERNRRLFAKAPLLEKKVMYGLLPDWRRRFEDADGVVTVKKMPAAMKQAAEAQDEDTPPRKGHLGVDEYEDEEGDWEDEQEGDDEEGDGLALDPEMLQTILREKLGAAGLEGADEAGFMQAIQQMMSGGGGDDAAGELANALLGKLTSHGGDEAVSGWLSREGVSLEDEDEASSVASEELPESARPTAAGRRNLHNSPPDSAVGFESNSSGGKATQMPLHSGSPTSSSKKRAAPIEDAKSGKKQKKVQFDVPPSESSDALQGASTLDDEDAPESEDPMMTESTPNKAKKTNHAATRNNEAVSESGANSTKTGRKRKAASPDVEKAEEKAPAKKKTRSRELEALGAVPEAPSPAPPAKRTRSARNAAGK